MSGGGGGSGAASASALPNGASSEGGSAEWRRTYDRVEALLPQVEELAADRARLETQRGLSGAREKDLEARLLKAEASRRRWKAAYKLTGSKSKIAELRDIDLQDSSTCEAPFAVNSSQVQVQSKQARNGAETSHNNADHDDIEGYFRAELRMLKQSCETLTSNKDKEVSDLCAVKDFLWNQLRTMDRDNVALLKIKEVEAAQATEAAQKLQQKIEELEMAAGKLQQRIEELQMAAQKKDDDIGRLRAENKELLSLTTETSNKRPRLYSKMQLDSKKDELDYNRVDLNIQRDYQGKGMRVSVKTLTGKTIIIEVKSSDTISSVKSKIFDETSIPPGAQRLLLSGKLLLDIHTIAEYGVHSNSMLHLVLRPMWQNDRVHICVNTLNGMTIVKFKVTCSETIDSLKAKIEDEVDIPPNQQCLIFDGKLLENGHTLADYNIRAQTAIDLQLRLHAVE